MPNIPQDTNDTYILSGSDIVTTRDYTIEALNDAKINFIGDVRINDETVGTPPGGYVTAEELEDAITEVTSNYPYVNVKDHGAIGNGIVDDISAINTAISVLPATGGTLIFPTGNYRISNTININGKRARVIGEGILSTYIDYYGSGTAIDLQEPNSSIENLIIRNQGGTGLKGLVVGKTNAGTVGIYRVQRVSIQNFLTAGLHLTNSELGRFEDITAFSCGTGFLIDASRNTLGAGACGLGNIFQSCRAHNNTSYGWNVNNQITMSVLDCESWSNGATYQVIFSGETYNCTIRALDVEDVLTSGTKSGIIVSGFNHYISILGYSLNKGIELSAASYCYIGPCRFSTVTQTILVGATCVDNTIFDGGNLGSIGEAAPTETHFVGRRSRARFMEIRGDANTGFLDFTAEQTSDPAGVVGRGKVYLKDAGGSNSDLYFRDGARVINISSPTPPAPPTPVYVPAVIATYSGTSVTAVIGDANKYLRFTGTNPVFTVPLNATVAFPLETEITGIGTATAMTIVATGGVTINKARTLVTVGADSAWSMKKVGTDEWDLTGDFV